MRRTGSPSLICSQSPKSATPTLSSSRLNASPTTPWSSSSISSARQFSSPCTRAMPSPSWSTAPTSARFVSRSNSSIRWRRIEVISSGRSFMRALLVVGVGWSSACTSAPGGCGARSSAPELLAQAVELAADARVEAQRAGLEDDARRSGRARRCARRCDLAARLLLDVGEDALELGLARARAAVVSSTLEHALLGAEQRLELGRDLARSRPRGPSRRAARRSCATSAFDAGEHLLEHARP